MSAIFRLKNLSESHRGLAQLCASPGANCACPPLLDGIQIVSKCRIGLFRAVALSALCLSLFADPPVVTAQVAAPDLSVPERMTAAKHAEILQLIEDLASTEYLTREAASEELIQLGSLVAPYVRQAAESPNLEVNTRAERILAIVSRKSFEETIEAFLADESGQGGATLPGWERSRIRLGDNADARRLFAEMYRAEPVLMAAYGEDTNATASSPSMEATAITSSFSIRVDELYDQHTQQNQINYQLRNQLKQTISDNVMALLFVGADQQIDIPRMNVTKFRMLFMQSWPAQRVAAAAERDRLRDWLAEWIVHRFSQPGREHEGITLGMQYDVPRTVELALRVLHRQENEPYVLMYAIPCVGKYGKDWHLTQLETLLSDEMVVHQRQQSVNGKVVQFETQLRDVALIVLLHRTEQAPQEYGFQEINQRADYLSLHHSFAFEDPKKREAAFRKWQAWRESHALFEGEPPRPKTKTETAKED